MLFRLHYSVQKAQQPDWLTGYECERPVKRRDRGGCLATKKCFSTGEVIVFKQESSNEVQEKE